MIVYILTMRGYGQQHIVGVYESRERAERVAESCSTGDYAAHYADITEHVLIGDDDENR